MKNVNTLWIQSRKGGDGMHPYMKRASSIVQRLCWNGLKQVGITPKTIARLTGKTAIDKSQVDLLKRMQNDNLKSSSPYRATEIWTQLGRRFEDWIYWEGIGEVEEQTISGFFSTPRPGDPKLLRYACWLLYQNLKSRDRLDLLNKIPATVRQSSGLAFEFEGRLVSWDLLISIDSLYSISDADKTILSQPVVVADIGAGWGRMGYVLKSVNPKSVYVVLDLPEALLVSSTYLPRLLRQERVLTYLESRNIDTFSKEKLQDWGCAFLGAQDLERFHDKSIDFVINIGSFQEMTRTQIDDYFSVIDRKLKGTLYMLQLWNAKTHTWNLGEVAGFESYPFRPTWKSLYVRNASWSDLYFEAAYTVT